MSEYLIRNAEKIIIDDKKISETKMADITTDITLLSQSFDTIINSLSNYTADDTKQKGSSSKALDSIIKSFSLLQTTLVTPENGVTRLNNIKNFFGDSGFVSVLSNISTDKKTLEDFKSNVTNICETFGGGDSSLGKQLELLSAPLASLKKGIDNLPSFEVGENAEPLAVTFKKRFDSISELAASLSGLEINDIEFKIPDISKLFNSIIETKVETENITKKEWEEITKDEYEDLQDGTTILKKLDATETEAEKFFKQVEKLNGTKDVTKYSSKLNTFTTNLLETGKVLNPFKNALTTFVKQDLSLSYKGNDIKATEDIRKVDENGKPTSELLYKKGDIIASAVPQPITKELIGQKINDINSLIAIGNEFQSLNLGANYADMTKLQVKLYDFIQTNVVGTGKTTEEKINTSDGLPLMALLLGDMVKPFNLYRAGLVTFVKGIDSATSDQYDTDEEITKWVSEQGKDGGKTVLKTFKKQGSLSQDIPGLTGKITNFLNLINVDTIGSWMTPIAKMKAIGTTVNNITGKYTDDKNKTRYVVVDNINSVVNSMSEVMKAIRKLPSKVTDDANDKNIQKKMQSISNVIHAFAKEALVFNTMTELDTLPYLVESLHLNDKEAVVGGEYVDEEGGGQVIDEKKYRSLKPEQQKKYKFRAKTKDLSMTHSIQMLCTFMSDIVKSVDKVSSVSIKTLIVAPVKVRMLSKGISKSLTAMISAIDYINQEADFHNLQQVIGWDEGTNQYILNADGSYKMEDYIDEDGKSAKRKIENARYVKGHFKAEAGLFKIGDYMATMIGMIDKVASFDTIKMFKASLKIERSIDMIASTIRTIAMTIVKKMRSLSSGPASESLKGLVSSTTETVNNILTEEKSYNLDSNASPTDIAKTIIDNSTSKTTNPGIFDVMISFFNVYDGMMKIADEKGLRLMYRSYKAKHRIKALFETISNILDEKTIEQLNKVDVKKTAEQLKETVALISSLSSLLNKFAEISRTAKKALKSMDRITTFLNEFLGLNPDGSEPKGDAYKLSFFDKYMMLIKRYQRSKAGDKENKDAIKEIVNIVKDVATLTSSLATIALTGLPALIGLWFLKRILKSLVGDEKEKGANGNSIMSLLARLKEKWNGVNGESGQQNGGVGMTLLLVTGSLLLFVSSLILVGHFVKQAFIGILGVAGLIATTIGILWVVSKFNKGGERIPERGNIGKYARTLLLISGAFLGFALSLGVLSVFVGKYNKQLLFGILQVSLLAAFGVGILWMMQIVKRVVDQGAKQLFFIAVSFLAFSLVLGVLSLFMETNNDQLWNTLLQLGLLVGIAVGTLFLLSKMDKFVMKGVGIMLLIGGAFLIFGITMKLMFGAVKDASWGDFGMIAATLVLMIGAVMAIGAIMAVPLVGQIALGMILSGVGIMLAVSGGFLAFANTLIKINEVFENNSPQQVEKNLESMLVCLDKMTAKLSDMPDISRQQKKSMRRLASITDSIGNMANVLRDIADFRIANIDEKTGKIIGYRYITESDFARAGDNTKMIVQKMIELGKILADDDNGISRKDARKAKRQGKRLGRLASLTEPIQSTIELIETIAGGQITYMKNGKEVTQDITAFFNENGTNVKTSLQTFITGVNDIFSGINTSNGVYVNEYQSNMMTTRMTAMSDMFDSMAAVADNGMTKNLTTVSNNTERMVNSINSLNTDKVKQFRNVLEDLQDFNDELSDIFEKLEETMSTLVDEIKSVNGMENKSSGTKQTTSSSTTTVQTVSSPNLTNIESDVDDLLNELRSIKALMQR